MNPHARDQIEACLRDVCRRALDDPGWFARSGEPKQMLTATLQRYADRDTADLHAAAMVAAIEACLAATRRT